MKQKQMKIKNAHVENIAVKGGRKQEKERKTTKRGKNEKIIKSRRKVKEGTSKREKWMESERPRKENAKQKINKYKGHFFKSWKKAKQKQKKKEKQKNDNNGKETKKK